MKVLIVDDSKMVAMTVAQMLKDAGHETVHAEDGKKAVQYFTEGGTADIVLLDWNMPNIDGPQFLELNAELKYTDSPIIMMTTENKPEFISRAIKLGVKEYLMKPFTSDILISKIEMTLL